MNITDNKEYLLKAMQQQAMQQQMAAQQAQQASQPGGGQELMNGAPVTDNFSPTLA